jgi:uncharacterized protein YciI
LETPTKLFVVSITYLKSLVEIEKQMPAHEKFLAELENNGKLVASGVKNPRNGSVIIITATTIQEVRRIITLDPFYLGQQVAYDVMEFSVSRFAHNFEELLKNMAYHARHVRM